MLWLVTIILPCGSRKGFATKAFTAPAVPMEIEMSPSWTMPAPREPADWSPAPIAIGVPAATAALCRLGGNRADHGPRSHGNGEDSGGYREGGKESPSQVKPTVS